MRSASASQLKAHREELTSASEDDPELHDVTPADLDDVRAEIVLLLNQGAPGAKNALFRALVHEIRVTGRHHIKPYFRIPASNRTPDHGSGVRIVTRWAPPAQQNANGFLVVEGPTIVLSPLGTHRKSRSRGV